MLYAWRKSLYDYSTALLYFTGHWTLDCTLGTRTRPMPETSKALYVVSSKPYIYYGMELRLPRSREAAFKEQKALGNLRL